MNFFNNLKVGNKILTGYIAISILMVGMATMQLLSLNEMMNDFAFLVEHDQPVLSNAHQLEKLVVDMETGERGFLITGEDEFLEPYVNALAKFDTLLETEKKLVSDNPPQVAVLEKIGKLQDQWIQQAALPLIAKRREVNRATMTANQLQEILKAGVGKSMMDQLRGLLAQIETNFRVKGDLESIILTFKIAKAMVDQETGQRGFLITGEDSFLEPYRDGKAQLAIDIAALRSRLVGDSDNLALLGQVDLLAAKWTEKAAKPEIDARRAMNANPITVADVSALIKAGTGKSILDAMRTHFDTFIQNEKELNVQRFDEAKEYMIQVRILIALLILGTVIIGLVLAFFIARSITRPLAKMTALANQMRAGNLNAMVDVKNHDEMNKIILRQDEMGEIGRAYDALASYFKTLIEDIVQVSQGLADGNLGVTPQAAYQGDFVQIKNAQELALSDLQQVVADIVQVSQGLAVGNLRVVPQADYRGDFVNIKTALQTALSDLRQVIEDIVLVSQGLAEGSRHVTPLAEYRGNFVQIKNALEAATANLAEAKANNTMQDWLKTGQAQLNEELRGEQDVAMLAKNAIDFLTTYLEAQVGLFYLVYQLDSAKPYLEVIASYAYTSTDNLPKTFLFGEGLVGQAALKKQTLCCAHSPEEYTYVVRSGLSNTIPRHVFIMPFLYENSVKGVIELGFFEAPTTIQQTFLEQIMPNIGIAVNTADSRTQMQQLLQQSQAQTEELQSQQEELRQTNEELQSQSEELQVQQEELRQANDELQERTQELERQRKAIGDKNVSLEKAQQAIEAKAKELELASKYKSEFLANMSHELRTPLNSLLILSQLLADNKSGHLSDNEVEYAQTIHSAGSDLLTLINEILDLSKVEAGKIEVHLENLPLASLMDTVEQKFRPLANKKNLAFQITIADNLPAVLRTDTLRLQQIINNLLSNAFKFTHQGEIKLAIQRCSLSNEEVSLMGLEPNHTLAFSVTDAGIGIPKDKQQVIFEAFQQAEGGTSRRYGGTGLGLSISRQLARLLGGELKLDSEEGKGSTFTLYLPETLRPEVQKSIGSEKSQTQMPAQTGDTLATTTPAATPVDIKDDRAALQPADQSLLIIEDDQKFASIIMELARERGFKCIIAEDGRTGLQFAEEYQPQAIILDVGLPQLDGWTVMERLKDNPKTRHVPVHFMSASEANRDAKKMGAIGYLHKPVSMGELSDALQKIEQFIAKTLKNLLIVVDNPPRQQQILGLVKGDNVQTALANTQAEALQQLRQGTIDCLILDVELQQQSGIQLLEQLHQNFSQIPIILYANRDLTPSEEEIVQHCADKLTIKAVKSPERLLDEATLFLHQVEAHLPKKQRKMLQIMHDKAALLAKKKALIVDDDMRNTFALMVILEEKDMEVVIAETGKEALEVLEKQADIQIVLMDIMMPEMDGYEAMRKIRAQPRYQKLPIIALTAKAMKDDRAKCLEAGANDYISKPVEAEKLISLMRVWLYR